MMAWGCASRTTCSKPVRYSSRSVRSSITESDAWRRVSCEFAAKCLWHAATPWDCTPRTKPAAILPAR